MFNQNCKYDFNTVNTEFSGFNKLSLDNGEKPAVFPAMKQQTTDRARDVLNVVGYSCW